MRTTTLVASLVKLEISRFPHGERPHMPGSSTPPVRHSARDYAPSGVAFRVTKRVGIRENCTFGAQWLAYPFLYRRFADNLAAADARLEADVTRYVFHRGGLSPPTLRRSPGALVTNILTTRSQPSPSISIT